MGDTASARHRASPRACAPGAMVMGAHVSGPHRALKYPMLIGVPVSVQNCWVASLTQQCGRGWWPSHAQAFTLPIPPKGSVGSLLVVSWASSHHVIRAHLARFPDPGLRELKLTA